MLPACRGRLDRDLFERKKVIRRINSFLRPLVIPILLVVSLSACALGRSVIEVTPPASAAIAGTAAVKITEVRDTRRFTVNPRDPSEPSLGEAAEINDPKITARAIGRKRGGFGAALGDVALPEGSTVAGLVRDAAQTALQDKGYRVVNETSPDYAAALPLALVVDRFWAWFTPGFFSVTATFKASVVMTGDPLIGGTPMSADGFASTSGLAVTESDWTDVVQRGLADLTARMRERIKAPAEIPH